MNSAWSAKPWASWRWDPREATQGELQGESLYLLTWRLGGGSPGSRRHPLSGQSSQVSAAADGPARRAASRPSCCTQSRTLYSV